MKMLKKGAMFGLDARIALAIFGALSVISGAALYSAIQQSKVVAAVADLNEVHKAFEQYWLDTGQKIGRVGALSFDVQELVDNTDNVSNWNGPYLPYAKHSSMTHALAYPTYDAVKVFGRSVNDAWGGTATVDSVMPSTCTGVQEPCGRWAMIELMDKTMADAIDAYIDGSVDNKNGRLRVYCAAVGKNCTVYFLDGTVEPTS